MSVGVEKRSHLPVDRGWAWVITFAGSGLISFCSGHAKSRGIILVELIERFPDASVTALLWIFMLAKLINKCSGPLCGLILTKTSNRTLSMSGVLLASGSLLVFGYLPRYEYMYIVYGIVYGLGNGMIVLSAFTAYRPYFDKRKALSLGLTMSGSGVGGLTIPILTRVLLNNFTFSGALLIISGLSLQTLVLAALLRPISYYERACKTQPAASKSVDQSSEDSTSLLSQAEEHALQPSLEPSSLHSLHTIEEVKLSSQQNGSSPKENYDDNFEDEKDAKQEQNAKRCCGNWRKYFNTKTLLFDIAILCYSTGTSAVFNSIPSLGKEAGVSKDLVALIITVTACCEIFAKIGNGWLADRRCISVCSQVAIYMGMNGLAAIFCGMLPSVAGIVVMLVTQSSVGTTVYSLQPLAVEELVGSKNLQKALTKTFVFQGISAIITSFGVGGVVELTGRWSYVFFFIGGFLLTGSLLMSAAALIVHRQQRNSGKT